jgi:hypothetical protein
MIVSRATIGKIKKMFHVKQNFGSLPIIDVSRETPRK